LVEEHREVDMPKFPSPLNRRRFLESAAAASAGLLFGSRLEEAEARAPRIGHPSPPASGQDGSPADYTLRIATGPVEIAPKRIISATTYNGQFPGPLLRLKEGQPVTVEIHNHTDTPEQLHWHGQMVPVGVDGSSEEGTPFIPAYESRRITFTPRPSGFRFYHTHVRAGANLFNGQYGGLVGPVYIEGREEPGRHDREVFLTLKEFEPWFSRGGDMASELFSPTTEVAELKEPGEAAMKASLAKGTPHGYEVNYRSFTINGRMLGHGEPIRVKEGERILIHVLNGSATEIRSLAMPGHAFCVVALDGNPVPNPVPVPVLWIGTAERISAIVEMNHPGVWVLGDLDDDDRSHGMGIVVEYAGRSGKPAWTAPPRFHWDYRRFAKPGAGAAAPEETFEMRFDKQNAADEGFNRWTINGVAFPKDGMRMEASFRVHEGNRYRIRMRNYSDDIHPVHLHRHSFEITRWGAKATAGVMKDVLMLPGYGEAEIDFVADNPGSTLFHCHQQLHMDFGFMTLFDYA
jgi:FtsP/CotA-like multicopper oxidase with cupredoxin domain